MPGEAVMIDGEARMVDGEAIAFDDAGEAPCCCGGVPGSPCCEVCAATAIAPPCFPLPGEGCPAGLYRYLIELSGITRIDVHRQKFIAPVGSWDGVASTSSPATGRSLCGACDSRTFSANARQSLFRPITGDPPPQPFEMVGVEAVADLYAAPCWKGLGSGIIGTVALDQADVCQPGESSHGYQSIRPPGELLNHQDTSYALRIAAKGTSMSPLAAWIPRAQAMLRVRPDRSVVWGGMLDTSVPCSYVAGDAFLTVTSMDRSLSVQAVQASGSCYTELLLTASVTASWEGGRNGVVFEYNEVDWATDIRLVVQNVGACGGESAGGGGLLLPSRNIIDPRRRLNGLL
jgi:hypothetical protein